MPVYEYVCSACGKRQELLTTIPNGGPAHIPCDQCGERAGKVISKVNIAQIKSGFKESDAVMQDPETGDIVPMTDDFMVTGTPREEESRATRDQLDLLRDLESGKIDKAEFQKRKTELDMRALDGDADGREVDPEEMDTYWKTPGEIADDKRSGLSYPKDPLPDGAVKVGEVDVEVDGGPPQRTDVIVDTKGEYAKKIEAQKGKK